MFEIAALRDGWHAVSPGKLDAEHSYLCWPILQSVAQWTRHATVDLRDAGESREPRK